MKNEKRKKKNEKRKMKKKWKNEKYIHKFSIDSCGNVLKTPCVVLIFARPSQKSHSNDERKLIQHKVYFAIIRCLLAI